MLSLLRTSLISRAYRNETIDGEAGSAAPEIDTATAITNLLGDPVKPEEPAPEEPALEAPETPAETPTAPEPELLEAEYEGKQYKLPKELKDALLRQQDYTRKTMELAEQRKAFEAERQATTKERESYAQNLNALASQLQAAVAQDQQVNWQELLNSDPVEYLRQKEAANQRQAALQQAQLEQQRVWQQQQAEQQTQLQHFLAEQREHLLAKLPDWKDAAKAKAEQTELKSYLKDVGYSEPEIANVADHRNIILARKAMLYDRLMSQKESVTQQVAKLPPKVEKPGVQIDRDDSKYQDAKRALRATGKADFAAVAIAELLNKR